jgi:hypothetical protein
MAPKRNVLKMQFMFWKNHEFKNLKNKTMKKIIVSIFGTFLLHILPAQMVATMEVKGPLPGACDSTKVYALVPSFGGQVEPVCPLKKDELLSRLQNEVAFLRENPKFKGKLMVNCIINCKGEMIRCEIDTKSGYPDLDSQVLKIFQSLTTWKAGTLNGNAVDCVMLYSIEIKKGIVSF